MDFSLSEEQLLKKTVREFAEAELAPHSREWDEKQEFPREVFTKLGELGLMGVGLADRVRRRRACRTLDYAIVMEELSRVDAGVALSRGRPQQPLLGPHLPGRQRGAEEEVPGAAGQGREGRLLGAHREQRGLGRGRHQDHGGARRRRTGC